MTRFLLIILIALPAFAQELTSDVLGVKTQIEDSISKRYQHTISTVLAEGAYAVSVRVGVRVKDPEKTSDETETQQDETANLSDFTLNVLNAERLLRNYESTSVFGGTMSSRYVIEQVSVNVGLSKELGDTYKAKFESWLQKQVSTEFGELGKVSVGIIESKPEGSALQEKSSRETVIEYLNKTQFLIGFFFLGGIFGVAAFWARRHSTKFFEFEGQKLQAQISAQNQAAERQTEKENAAAALPEERASEEATPADPHFEEKFKKLASVSSEQLENVYSAWSAQGERGFLKFALFNDALVAGGHPASPTAVSDPQGLGDAFRKIPTLQVNERRRLAEEAYWELLAVKNLGHDKANAPFAYFGNLSAEQIIQLLKAEGPQTQAYALLYMPQSRRKEVFTLLSAEERAKLVGQTFQLGEYRLADVEKADQDLKKKAAVFERNGRTLKSTDSALRLLRGLQPKDEIQLVYAMKKDSVQFRQLKKFPYLALVPDMLPEPRSQVLENATAEEIRAFCEALPEGKEEILKGCSKRIAEIVADDLSKAKPFRRKDSERYLLTLRKRLESVYAGSDLDELFEPETTSTTTAEPGIKNAA